VWRWRHDRCLQALKRATRDFRAMRAGPVVVFQDPTLDPLETALFRVTCEQQIAETEALFGLRLRAWWPFSLRLRVYLFQSCAAVSDIYGGPVSGFASWDHWHIAVNLNEYWGEIVRHEVAHILGGRWNPRPMTLLCEGLAVWAQRSIAGVPIDDWAKRVLRDLEPTMQCLLGQDPPLGTWKRQRYYILAGSFTRALSRRFGFRSYQTLYRDKAISAANFAKRFERDLGVPLLLFAEEWLAAVAARPRATTVRRSLP
jgi:hypothetical protein